MLIVNNDYVTRNMNTHRNNNPPTCSCSDGYYDIGLEICSSTIEFLLHNFIKF